LKKIREELEISMKKTNSKKTNNIEEIKKEVII
jgi:hypothetical protein